MSKDVKRIRDSLLRQEAPFASVMPTWSTRLPELSVTVVALASGCRTVRRSAEHQLHRAQNPLVDLIRTCLDGRTNRWLELIGLFQARREAADEELIAGFVVSSVDRTGAFIRGSKYW